MEKLTTEALAARRAILSGQERAKRQQTARARKVADEARERAEAEAREREAEEAEAREREAEEAAERKRQRLERLEQRRAKARERKIRQRERADAKARAWEALCRSMPQHGEGTLPEPAIVARCVEAARRRARPTADELLAAAGVIFSEDPRLWVAYMQTIAVEAWGAPQARPSSEVETVTTSTTPRGAGADRPSLLERERAAWLRRTGQIAQSERLVGNLPTAPEAAA